MNKLARSKSKDPKQENLRAKKATWNAEVSAFIDDMIHFKKWLNGWNNKFFTEKSKITSEIPNNPVTVMNGLLIKFNDLANEGLNIVNEQKTYSQGLAPVASSASEPEISKRASNRFSRLLSQFKGPIFFGKEEAKVTNKYRIDILKVLAQIKESLRDLQVDILFKDIKDFPELAEDYQFIGDKVDVFEATWKSYFKHFHPDELVTVDDSSTEIEKYLDSVQKQLDFASKLPVLPKKEISSLNKRIVVVLHKLAKNERTKDLVVENNLIKHDFEDVQKKVLTIWNNILSADCHSIEEAYNLFISKNMSEQELESLTSSLPNNLKAKYLSDESSASVKESLFLIQREMEFSSKLPVHLKKQTHMISKRISALLSKIDRSISNQKDIIIEFNLIEADYNKILQETMNIWRKIFLSPLKNIYSIEEIFEKFEQSELSSADVLDLAKGFPNTNKSKLETIKFNLIVGEPLMTREFNRSRGDGDNTISFYKKYVESGNIEMFKDFPTKDFKNLKVIVESAKDREHFSAEIVEQTVEVYNKLLNYFNDKFMMADILSEPAENFSALSLVMPDLLKKIPSVKRANVVSYNIAKQIGLLKNNLLNGDASSGIKISLNKSFDNAVEFVNRYMNILEDRILTEDEFENLKKDFADFFSKTSVHFTALEKSNIADLRDDVDAEKTYNKALHSAMKSKDKSRIKKLLS